MASDLRPLSILLVEDTPDDERLTVRALQRTGLNLDVRVAHDGAEALDMLFGSAASEKPRLVLLDLKLPKVNGIEVLQAIRDHESTVMLPVVVLTSSDEQRDLEDSYRSHCSGYVRKAVDYNEYMETMRKTLDFWLVVNRVPAMASELQPMPPG